MKSINSKIFELCICAQINVDLQSLHLHTSRPPSLLVQETSPATLPFAHFRSIENILLWVEVHRGFATPSRPTQKQIDACEIILRTKQD
jgi:hypothetical protein